MVTEQEFNLIEKRFEAWNENFMIACVQLGNFTKDQALDHMKARDEVGSKLAEIQIYYLKKLKERK